MFKRNPPPPTPPLTLVWPKVSARTQTLWFVVDQWHYKIFPSRRASVFGTSMFQFDGRSTTDTVKGLAVTGEVEILEAGESLGMFEDHWKSVPDSVEGYLFLMDDESRARDPGIALTLYCLPGAMDYVFKAFQVAAQSRDGGLGIELVLDCPNNTGEDFWREAWRKEWLRVCSWKLFSGAQLVKSM